MKSSLTNIKKKRLNRVGVKIWIASHMKMMNEPQLFE